jgi:hypothetical protein
MELSFGSLGKVKNTGANFNELFDCVYDSDGESVYVSKETFKHTESGFDFDYKLAIYQADWDDTWAETATDKKTLESKKGKCFTKVSIIPAIESLSDKVKEDIAEDNGMDVSEIDDYYDVYSYGADITFDFQEHRNNSYQNEADNKLLAIANGYRMYIGMFGFFMDKNVNCCDSGWDYIKKFIKTA